MIASVFTLHISAYSKRTIGNKEEKTRDGLHDLGGPETRVGIAISLAGGIFINTAAAHINGNADVDAQQQITVKADALNEIDVLELWGVNLIAPFSMWPLPISRAIRERRP